MDECVLCAKYAQQMQIGESSYWFVVYDDFPLRTGHMLIVPKRHVEGDLSALSPIEWNDLYLMEQKAIRHVKTDLHADGYNLGVNCGEAAGQTLPHLHIHLIPRYAGDVEDPRGGIRKFLPNPLAKYP